jgi:hypothetical protein
MMNVRELLTDIHVLEEELLDFERNTICAPRSSTLPIWAARKPADDAWVLDFSEWAAGYRTWLTRQAEYRNEVQRLQGSSPSLEGLIRVVA